jgi:hypothetical protein
MVVHIPVDEGADRIQHARASVQSVVKYIMFERGMLEDARKDEMPRAQGIGEEDEHGGEGALEVQAGKENGGVDAQKKTRLVVNFVRVA